MTNGPAPNIATGLSPRAQAARQARHMATFVELSRAVAEARDATALFRLADRVAALFEAERAFVLLHDARRHALFTVLAHGLDAGGREIRIAADEGLAGRVLQTQESLCLCDASANPHFDRRLSFATGYVPHSILIAPIIGPGGRRDGVLQVLDRRLSCFSADDLPLLDGIAVQLGAALDRIRTVEAHERQFDSFAVALSTALDARDPLTAIHSVNVANYAVAMGALLGLSQHELKQLRLSGLLHDLGKIGVPEHVLNKHGRLTSEEYEEMKRHAEYTREILRRIEFTPDLAGLDFVAACHHEMLDGSGYPQGLEGGQIPLAARILAVADVFDALTQARHHRQCLDHEAALAQLDRMVPGQLDGRSVAALRTFLHRQA